MARKTEQTIIVSWIGHTDATKAEAGQEAPGDNGPIRTLTDITPAKRVCLLVSRGLQDKAENVRQWVLRGTKAECELIFTDLADPTSYQEVYDVTERFFDEHIKRTDTNFIFNVTPGTPATQGVLLYLSHIRCPGSRTVSVKKREDLKDPENSQINEISLPFRLSPDNWRGEASSTLSDEQRREILEIFAPQTQVNLLLLGETGVGKSHFARQIHEASKVKGEFVSVNCALLGSDTEMAASMLFGHVAGAYTDAKKDREGAFPTAANGTLFLDEIGEIPNSMQASLLTVLNDKKIRQFGSDKTLSVDNVRIIAATNRNLLEEVRTGRFREDLYYRIAMYRVTLPPLRQTAHENQEHFRKIVESSLQKISEANEMRRDWKLTSEAWDLLYTHDWPGNRRELEHALLLACIVANHHAQDTLEAPLLRKYLEDGGVPARPRSTPSISWGALLADIRNQSLPSPLETWLNDIKAAIVREAMRRAETNVSQAAKLLGVPYQQLQYYWRKLKNS